MVQRVGDDGVFGAEEGLEEAAVRVEAGGEQDRVVVAEVLGEAANDALINAWAAAYGQLADALIAQEGGLYLQAAT